MKFRTLLAIPFVALALVGCSSGSSGSDTTTPANSTVIKAIEGIAWDAASYTATATDGQATISLVNNSSLPHDLRLLDADNVDVGLVLNASGRGEVQTEMFGLAPGSYQVICTIAGHGNMKATLVVS